MTAPRRKHRCERRRYNKICPTLESKCSLEEKKVTAEYNTGQNEIDIHSFIVFMRLS